ncbi:MAG: hypothetical protein ACXVCV_24715, partial [Polyangia bacterium]
AYEMVLGRPPFISDNPADAIQMHLCASPPRPSILWKQIPPQLEALLLKLLAKDSAERATLATLKPMATQALDRVADAPPPRAPLSPRRHAVRLGAVALTFIVLALAGSRPSKLQAQRLHGAAVASPSVTTAARGIPGATPAVPSLAPGIGAPGAPGDSTLSPHRATRRAKHAPRDGNYLLDPFTH